MLTFFEYLRQRAHRSILAGVKDALEDLEGNSPNSDNESAAKLLDQFQDSPDEPSAEPSSLLGNSDGQEIKSKNDNESPPPRKRGRPPKARQNS